MAIRKTFRGKSIDMDQMHQDNERSVALGNMRVNARGDKINGSRDVVEPANQRTKVVRNEKQVTVTGSLKTQPSSHEKAVFTDEKKRPPKKAAVKNEVEQDNGDIVVNGKESESE